MSGFDYPFSALASDRHGVKTKARKRICILPRRLLWKSLLIMAICMAGVLWIAQRFDDPSRDGILLAAAILVVAVFGVIRALHEKRVLEQLQTAQSSIAEKNELFCLRTTAAYALHLTLTAMAFVMLGIITSEATFHFLASVCMAFCIASIWRGQTARLRLRKAETLRTTCEDLRPG